MIAKINEQAHELLRSRHLLNALDGTDSNVQRLQCVESNNGFDRSRSEVAYRSPQSFTA
jgi:hypothetical protein